MFNKKRLCAALIGLSCMSSVSAGFYFAPTLVWQNISARTVSFEGISPRWGIGYDTIFNEAGYGSLELFADVPYFTLNTKPSLFPPIKPKVTYGLSILPGMVLDDALIGFLRLGGVLTYFPKYDVNRGGYQLGLGFNYRYTMSLSFRAEYDFVGYKVLDGVGQPKSNQASLGLIYDLDCWSEQCG